MHTKFYSEIRKERGQLGDLGVHERKTLTLILDCSVKVGTGLNCFRVGEHSNGLSGYIKAENILTDL
jgi:hypothetical protein